MSLIVKLMEPCHKLIRAETDDPYGGHQETFVQGKPIRVFIRKDSSSEMQVAEKKGLGEFFTLVFNRNETLRQHDLIRRDKDGATFRVTSNALDSEAPDPSSVLIAKVSAERVVNP